MFDRHPKPMKEEETKYCRCSRETEIVIAGMGQRRQTDRSVPSGRRNTCGQTEHFLGHSLLHYKDISPVFDRDGVMDDTKYVNDQPEGAIQKIISEQVQPIKIDEIKPEGVNVHWTIRGSSYQRRVKRGSLPHGNKVSSQYGGLAYMFPGDYVSWQPLDDPVKVHYPTMGGLTEDEVYSICTGAVLNSSLAHVCGPYLNDDLTSALEFCVLGSNSVYSPMHLNTQQFLL